MNKIIKDSIIIILIIIIIGLSYLVYIKKPVIRESFTTNDYYDDNCSDTYSEGSDNILSNNTHNYYQCDDICNSDSDTSNKMCNNTNESYNVDKCPASFDDIYSKSYLNNNSVSLYNSSYNYQDEPNMDALDRELICNQGCMNDGNTEINNNDNLNNRTNVILDETTIKTIAKDPVAETALYSLNNLTMINKVPASLENNKLQEIINLDNNLSKTNSEEKVKNNSVVSTSDENLKEYLVSLTKVLADGLSASKDMQKYNSNDINNQTTVNNYTNIINYLDTIKEKYNSVPIVAITPITQSNNVNSDMNTYNFECLNKKYDVLLSNFNKMNSKNNIDSLNTILSTNNKVDTRKCTDMKDYANKIITEEDDSLLDDCTKIKNKKALLLNVFPENEVNTLLEQYIKIKKIICKI